MWIYFSIYSCSVSFPHLVYVLHTGAHVIPLEEEGYWGSPCSSSESLEHRDEYSPGQTILSSQSGPEGSSPYGSSQYHHHHHHSQQVYCPVEYEKSSKCKVKLIQSVCLQIVLGEYSFVILLKFLLESPIFKIMGLILTRLLMCCA